MRIVLKQVPVQAGRFAPFVALREFFLSYRKTLLGSGELIAAIRIPKPLPTRLAFYKAAKRVMDDISTVAAAIS